MRSILFGFFGYVFILETGYRIRYRHSRQDNFFLISNASWIPLGPIPPLTYKDSRVAGGKLTTHRHQEPKLRIREAVPPRPRHLHCTRTESFTLNTMLSRNCHCTLPPCCRAVEWLRYGANDQEISVRFPRRGHIFYCFTPSKSTLWSAQARNRRQS